MDIWLDHITVDSRLLSKRSTTSNMASPVMSLGLSGRRSESVLPAGFGTAFSKAESPLTESLRKGRSSAGGIQL